MGSLPSAYRPSTQTQQARFVNSSARASSQWLLLLLLLFNCWWVGRNNTLSRWPGIRFGICWTVTDGSAPYNISGNIIIIIIVLQANGWSAHLTCVVSLLKTMHCTHTHTLKHIPKIQFYMWILRFMMCTLHKGNTIDNALCIRCFYSWMDSGYVAVSTCILLMVAHTTTALPCFAY